MHLKYFTNLGRKDPFNITKGGVDLNRNYGFRFGFDDKGSSPDPCSEYYRGSAPFSEPETKAIRDFVV